MQLAVIRAIWARSSCSSPPEVAKWLSKRSEKKVCWQISLSLLNGPGNHGVEITSEDRSPLIMCFMLRASDSQRIGGLSASSSASSSIHSESKFYPFYPLVGSTGSDSLPFSGSFWSFLGRPTALIWLARACGSLTHGSKPPFVTQ